MRWIGCASTWMCACKICILCMWIRVFINWNLCNLFEAKIKIQHMQTNCWYANNPSIILNIYDKRILNTNICMCSLFTCTDFSTVYYIPHGMQQKALFAQRFIYEVNTVSHARSSIWSISICAVCNVHSKSSFGSFTATNLEMYEILQLSQNRTTFFFLFW